MVSAFHEMILMFSGLFCAHPDCESTEMSSWMDVSQQLLLHTECRAQSHVERRGAGLQREVRQSKRYITTTVVTTIDTVWAQKIRNGQIIPPISEILALIFFTLKVKCFKLVCLCCLTALARYSQKDWNGQSNQSMQDPLFTEAEPEFPTECDETRNIQLFSILHKL